MRRLPVLHTRRNWPLIFEALKPLEITTRSLGRIALETGERHTWPDEAVRMLLEKFPEKIRVIQEQPHGQFRVGQQVAYRIPVVQHATSYSWESHTGTIDAIDIHNERLTILPESEAQPWRIVSWCYCQPKASTDEN